MSSNEDISYEVMMLVNQLRKDPPYFVRDLEEMAKHFKGTDYRPPGAKVILETQEGAVAVREAADFLRKAKPVTPLNKSKQLCEAAQKWAEQLANKDKAKAGSLGSRIEEALGPDAPGFRAENIAYGSSNAKDIVLQLIIDDGVSDRGHRSNLFSENYQIIGVGYSPHKQMDAVCVIDFVGDGKKQGTPAFADNPIVMKDKEKSKSIVSQGLRSPSPSISKPSKPLLPGEIPESEWPAGYSKMQQKTQTSTKSGMKKTTVTYIFTMPDGEEITKINEVTERIG